MATENVFTYVDAHGGGLKLGRIRLLHAKCKELVPKHHAMTVKLQSLLTSTFGWR
jgi:hypothetical protein